MLYIIHCLIFIRVMRFLRTFSLFFLAISGRMNAELPYYCVTKADPYTLTRCPKNYSLCYTIENDSNDTIIYGCANDETSLSSNKFWSYSRCSDNLHDFCPSEEPFDISDAYPRLCCCDSSRCNGVFIKNNRSWNSEESNNTENVVESVFKRSLSKRKGVTPVKESSFNWGSIVGIASGALGVLCMAAFATFAVNRRLTAKRKEGAPANMESSESAENGTDLEDEDATQEGMECGPGKKCANVMHIERTKTIVPSRLSLPERAALLRSLKKNKKMKTVHKGKRPPTITEVITFATTDEITLTESGDAKKGENDVFKDESSGGLLLSSEVNEEWPRISGASCALKLVTKMIAHGPRQYSFHLDELTDVLKKGTEVFLREPSLLEVPIPCVVYGDIHGQYSDLHRWFNLNGWPWKVRSVFLGDFVDRGTHGIEVIALLTALKVAFPDRLFICRGNHEEESLNRAYSFLDEILIRFSITTDNEKGRALYRYFKEMFNAMPLAALIGGRILGMHGGISPKLTSLQDIRDIRRPLEDFEVGSLACDLVWSDPDTNPEGSGFRPNFEREPNKGIGQLFGPDTVQKICEKLNIELIIRGHQAPLQGYAIFADGCLMTLFSAPGYKGSTKSDINMGASLQISANMNITIKRIEVTEKFRQNRVQDGENMRTLSKGIRRCRS